MLVAKQKKPGIEDNIFQIIEGIDNNISSVALHFEKKVTNPNLYAIVNQNDETYRKNHNEQMFKKIINNSEKKENYKILKTKIATKNNNLFVAKYLINETTRSFEGAIYRYDAQAKKFKIIKEHFWKENYVTLFFLDKKNNNIYVSTEKKFDESIIYKLNISEIETDTTPTFLLELTTSTASCLTVDNSENIYIGTNNGEIYKYDNQKKETKQLLKIKDSKISTITNHNNNIYAAVESSRKSYIYQCLDNRTFIKTKIKTHWIIDQLTIDDDNHLFAGGTSNKLYAATISKNNKLSDLNVISNQEFDHITCLVYDNNVLTVASENKVFVANIKNFNFP